MIRWLKDSRPVSRISQFYQPFLDNLQPLQVKDIFFGLLFFLVIFVFMASYSTEALINGDAALYLQQMQKLNLTGRPVHLGYMLLGAGFIRIIPGSDDRVLNLMNCFLGAVSITTVGLIAYVLCRRYIAAILAGMLLLVHYQFMENSLYAEVYTPQTCFLLMAVFLWLRDKAIFAGLFFTISFLITPSTLFALPCFFILRPRWRPILIFCVIFTVLATAAILPVHKSYLWGGRGLLKATKVSVNLGQAADKEGNELFFNLFMGLPFVLAGLIEIFGSRKYRPFAVGLLFWWGLNFFLGEKYGDVPVQLPLYGLLCVVAGLGMNLFLRLSDKKTYGTLLAVIMLAVVTGAILIIGTIKKPETIAGYLPNWFFIMTIVLGGLSLLVAVVPIFRGKRVTIIITTAALTVFLTNGFATYGKIQRLNRYHTGYRNTAIEISSIAQGNYLVIGYFTRRILFEHYVFHKAYTPNCFRVTPKPLIEYLKNKKSSSVIEKLQDAMADGRHIIILSENNLLFHFLQNSGYRVGRYKYVFLATPKR